MSIAVGDFDGDGRQDLAVLFSDTVSVLIGRGDGTFAPQATVAVGSLALGLAVGDFNGDGHEDLTVMYQPGGVSVLLGHGDGTFGAQASYGTGGAPTFPEVGDPLAVGDLNGDGRLDLATANYASSVSVLLGRGGGTFGTPVLFLAGRTPSSLAIGNFHGNRRPDIAVVNTASQDVWVLLNQGRFPAVAPPKRASGTPSRGGESIWAR